MDLELLWKTLVGVGLGLIVGIAYWLWGKFK